MNPTLLLISILCIILLFVLLFVPWQTFYLIARVQPFEQELFNSPSLLVLGDSTGYGTGATAAHYSVPGRIAADFDVSISNNSVNGRTIGELKHEVVSISDQHEIILLMIGANDVIQKRDVSVVEEELRTIVNTLAPKTEHLIMISSGNVGGAPRYEGSDAVEYEELTRQYRTMFKSVSESTKLVYVDLFVEPEDDVFISEPEKYIAIDGLHPSDEGYGYWYDTLRPTIESLLQNN